MNAVSAPAGGWKRTLNQNDYIHALIREAVKRGFADDSGELMDEHDAKVALVTAWMIERGHPSKIIAFRGRPVQLRRSTTTFDKAEASEFAEFIIYACAERGIILTERP